MRRFIEKLIIIIFSLYTNYKFSTGTDLVFCFLIAIIFSTILDLITIKKHRYIIYSVFAILAFYDSMLLFYFPLILYNLYIDFSFYTVLFLPLLFINFHPIILILSILSLYFSESTYRMENMIKENINARDSLKEDALYLKKYNEQLTVDKEKDIRIAILTERNRIAREIHDSIGHTISSSILQVKALNIISKESLKEPLDLLQNTLDNGMNDIRKSLQGLRDESLDLKDKINLLINQVPHLDVELLYNMEDLLEYDIRIDILSIVKEAITNTVKHSNATKLNISLFDQPQFYSIIIKDNGDKAPSFENKGIGLDYMNETASKYNGSFNYAFQKGFKIHITLMKGK